MIDIVSQIVLYPSEISNYQTKTYKFIKRKQISFRKKSMFEGNCRHRMRLCMRMGLMTLFPGS